MMYPMAHDSTPDPLEALDPTPDFPHTSGEEDMDLEQKEALDRVRKIYHQGSHPLTVARARYDLMRRGVL